MSDDSDRGPGLKSAYEAALERLDAEGVPRPDASALSEEQRAAVAEARSRAEAKLAEVEILHADRLKAAVDPVERQKAEEEYLIERRRIESERDRRIEQLRSSS